MTVSTWLLPLLSPERLAANAEQLRRLRELERLAMACSRQIRPREER